MELVAFNIPSKPTVSLKTNLLPFDYLAHPHKTSSANLPSLPPPSSALHSFQRPDSDPHFFFSQSTRLSHCQPGPFYLHANGDLCCKKDIGACTGLVSAVSEGSAWLEISKVNLSLFRFFGESDRRGGPLHNGEGLRKVLVVFFIPFIIKLL